MRNRHARTLGSAPKGCPLPKTGRLGLACRQGAANARSFLGQFDEPAKRRIAGSLAPIIALWLLHRTGSTLGISIYVALACVISVIAALTARETSGESFATIDVRLGSARNDFNAETQRKTQRARRRALLRVSRGQ